MAVERFPIESGHVMAFARAVGDYNPRFHGEDEGEQIAPPTFVISDFMFDPDGPMRPHPGRPWRGSGREPTIARTEGAPRGGGGGGGGGLALHAEETFEIHRPVRVGDVLTKTTHPGETWEREGGRGGKLKFSETVSEYRDQNGELVVTARFVGVVTERNPDS